MKNTVTIKKKREINMLEGSIVKNMLLFAVPLIFTGVLQNLYNTADTIVVGNFGGTAALSAVGASATTISIVVTVVINVFVGMNIILARQLGADERADAATTCRTGYVTSLILGIVLTVIGQILTLPLLELTECPESVMDGAELYLRIYFCGVPALLFNNYASSVLRISGDSRTPFIYLSVSGVVNVIFNILFILAFGNPVAGVALATIFSLYVASVMFFVHMIKLDGPCKLEPFNLRLDLKTLGKIVRYGIPSCISAATFSLTNLIIQPAINAFGEIGLAGNAAAVSIEAYLYSITSSFGTAVVTFMGQNIGARNKERVIKVLKSGYAVSIAVMSVYTVFIIILGRQLLGLFIPGEIEAIEFGQLRLTFIMSAAVINGIMSVNGGALQAYGFTIGQMFSNLIGVCLFRIVWMFCIYPMNRVPWLLWLCYPVSWFMTAVGVLVMVIILTKKYLSGKSFKL